MHTTPSFEQFVQTHRANIVRTAQRLGTDRDDVISKTWLRFDALAESYDPERGTFANHVLGHVAIELKYELSQPGGTDLTDFEEVLAAPEAEEIPAWRRGVLDDAEEAFLDALRDGGLGEIGARFRISARQARNRFNALLDQYCGGEPDLFGNGGRAMAGGVQKRRGVRIKTKKGH